MHHPHSPLVFRKFACAWGTVGKVIVPEIMTSPGVTRRGAFNDQAGTFAKTTPRHVRIPAKWRFQTFLPKPANLRVMGLHGLRSQKPLKTGGSKCREPGACLPPLLAKPLEGPNNLQGRSGGFSANGAVDASCSLKLTPRIIPRIRSFFENPKKRLDFWDGGMLTGDF